MKLKLKGSSGAVKGAMVILAFAFIVASVSYMMPALASHTAITTLEPEWSPPSTNVLYTVTIENDDSSTAAIDEVRIFRSLDYTDFDCKPKTGWELINNLTWFDPVIGLTKMCWYYTLNSSYNIQSDSSEDFNFSATTPAQEDCELFWKFETRDEESETQGDWKITNATTGVDNTPPEMDKQLSGPQVGDCPPGDTCWINCDTTITVNSTDIGDEVCAEEQVPPSEMDYCEFIVNLDDIPAYDSWIVEDNEDGDDNGENNIIEHTFDFDEDSVHELIVRCYDNAGNYIEDVETFRVDCTDPETEKVVSEPKKIAEVEGDTVEWVDTVTTITFNADDPEAETTPEGVDCSIGVDKTWYMNVIDLSENACWYEESCNPITELYDVTGKPFPASPYEHGDVPCINAGQDWCASDCEGIPCWEDDEYDSWEACVEDYAHKECSVDPLWKLYDGTPINKNEESCHILQYFSVDDLGNIEDMDVNCFFVDKTPPELVKEVSEPNNFWTETIAAADRIVALQYDDGSWDWDVTSQAGPTGTTYLNIAGVTADVLLDAFMLTGDLTYLDAAIKTGDYLVAVGIDSGTRYNAFSIVFLYRLADVTGDTTYSDYADDVLDHILNEENYWSTHNGNNCGTGCTASQLLEALKDYRSSFGDPSGIVVWDLFKFIEAAQIAGETSFANDMANALDGYMSQVGFDNSIEYYELGLAGGIIALDNEGSIDPSGYVADLLAEQNMDGSFDDSEPIQATAYALMALEQVGETDAAAEAAFFLASEFGYSGYEGWLEDGTEYSEVTSEAAQALYDINANEGTPVTPETDIEFTCIDQQPHPSGDEKFCYRVSYDIPTYPTYITEDYCDPEDLEEGWCCIQISEEPDNTFTFNFNQDEDSFHDLEYYCEDAVGKRTETHVQYYRVDTQPPVITKEMIGEDHLADVGTCPPSPEPSDDECYVRDNGENGVNITVAENMTYENCAVGGIECYYKLWWQTSEEECDDSPYEEGWCLVGHDEFNQEARVIFTEDSTHDLYIYCEDGLGNSVEETEEFLVDSTPPETIKMYGEPFKIEPDCEEWCDEFYDGPYSFEECTHHYCTWWINSSTPINLTAEDEKVGVDKIYWRNLWFPENDEICYRGPLAAEKTLDGDGIIDDCNPEYYREVYGELPDWTEYTGEFFKTEESCHVIEYYSVDRLGNEEPFKWQCVFVDNTGPEVNKTVGDPKVPGEGECTITNITDKLDVFFLFDLTGSMGDVIDDAQTEAVDVMNDISGLVPDSQFGAGSFMDANGHFESCGYASNYGSGGDYPWNLDQDITSNTSAVSTAINGLSLGSGDDGPEGYAYALQKTQSISWRPDAKRVVVIFQDNVPHDCNLGDYDSCDETTGADPGDNGIVGDGDDVTWDGVTAELKAAGISVISIDSGSATSCRNAVWGYLANETGGANAELGEDFADTIVELVSEVIYDCDSEIDWYVSQGTPITLNCEDPEPHPVDQETLYWRYSTWLDGFTGEPNYSEWYNETYENLPIEIKFPEDCWHDLEYYCVDHLGNEGEMHTQYYIVDTVPPVINKTITGPQLECPPDGYEGDCYMIDGVTNITIDAYDPEPHPVDNITCEWWYELDGKGEYYLDSEGVKQEGRSGLVPIPFTINFPEETEHTLHVYCEDALQNWVDDVETFLVDKTPPSIWKEYRWPKEIGKCLEWEWVRGECLTEGFGDCGDKICVKWADWISSDTKIKAGVNDVGPHETGIQEVKYRTTIVNDSECIYEIERQPDYDCEDVEGSGNWTTVDPEDYDEFNFTIDEDSCHLIEIMATDNVDKCDLHKQWVYVDNTGPDPVKTIGEPKDEWHPGVDGDPESYFYPEETANCWTGEEGEIECWEATTLTPIVMDCEDPEPHPVGEKKICFNVDVDGEDKTKDYCREYGGWYHIDFDDEIYGGVCCRWLGPEDDDGFDFDGWEHFGYKDKCDEVQDIECYNNRKLFYFLEETEHNLQYYCIDELWNKGPVDEEKFKIEGNKFEIPLFKKWNLVSVPFTLLNSDPEVVFDKIYFDGEQIPYENISQYIDSVTTYDPDHVICGQDWCVWTPGDGPDDLKILPGWGYWVMVTDKPEEDWCGFKPKCFWHKDNEEPLWMVIGGSLFSPAETPPSRNLVKGWNLIGYYGTSWEDYDQGDFDFMCGDQYGGWWKFGTPEKELYGDQVYCALNSLIDTQEGYPRWSSLWSYVNCGNHNTNWLGLNACIDPSPFSAQDRMYAGRGYWLELDVNDTYAPATNCIWNDDFECVQSGGGFPI